MRILSVHLDSIVGPGHPAYRKDVDVRSCDKVSELHIEDSLLAFECYDQLESLLDLSYLADLVADAEEPEKVKEDALDETQASILRDLAEHQEKLDSDLQEDEILADFDQASYDRETTEAMGLPIGTKTNLYEYRLVLQIEQLDENGRMLCTYGPEPAVLLQTDDADDAIEAFHNRMEVSS